MENYNMDKQLVISKRFNYLTFILMGIGLVTIIAGFFVNPVKTWANYLMNNYYFLSLAIGATFFAALAVYNPVGMGKRFYQDSAGHGKCDPCDRCPDDPDPHFRLA